MARLSRSSGVTVSKVGVGQLAVDPDARRRSGLEMDVRALPLDDEAEDRGQIDHYVIIGLTAPQLERSLAEAA